MKNLSLGTVVLAALLVGCESDAPEPPAAVGADRDEHGCIGSAGYRWCESTGQCERSWELAKREGFEDTPGKFEAFCVGGSN